MVRRIFGWGYVGGAIRVGPLAYPPPVSPVTLNHGGLSTARSMPCMALLGYPQVPVYIPVDICGTSLWNIGGDPRHMCRSSHHVTIVTPCVVRHINHDNVVTKYSHPLTDSHVMCPRFRMRSKRLRGDMAPWVILSD